MTQDIYMLVCLFVLLNAADYRKEFDYFLNRNLSLTGDSALLLGPSTLLTV
jgi:hypothetical protein